MLILITIILKIPLKRCRKNPALADSTQVMPSVGSELSITKPRRIALKAQTVLTSARSFGCALRLEMETICRKLVLKLLSANYI